MGFRWAGCGSGRQANSKEFAESRTWRLKAGWLVSKLTPQPAAAFLQKLGDTTEHHE